LGIIKRNFFYLTPDSFVVLYKALVQSHLEVGIGSKCVESASSAINRERSGYGSVKMELNKKKLQFRQLK